MSKKITLEIPTELSSITLGQYQRYLKILDQNEGEEGSDFIALKAIEIFCNVSLKEAYNIPVNQFTPITEHISELFKEETPLQRDLKIIDSDKKELCLGFIPKLEDMTMGEFVDLDNYITDWQEMHKAMAVLYRPMRYRSSKGYLIHEYKASEEYHQLMKDMPVTVALGAMVFFYRLGRELSLCLMDSLMGELPNLEAPIHKDLQKSGVGINQFMHLLTETSEELMKLQKYHINNV